LPSRFVSPTGISSATAEIGRAAQGLQCSGIAIQDYPPRKNKEKASSPKQGQDRGVFNQENKNRIPATKTAEVPTVPLVC
jgi:hypothetical protein